MRTADDPRWDYPERDLTFWDEHLSYVAVCLNVEIGDQITNGDPAKVGPFIEALRLAIRLIKAEDDSRRAAT